MIEITLKNDPNTLRCIGCAEINCSNAIRFNTLQIGGYSTAVNLCIKCMIELDNKLQNSL